jgi:hypothetical protein
MPHLVDFERNGPGASTPDTLKAVRDDANAPAHWRTQARAELARRGEAARRSATQVGEPTLGVTESSKGRTTTVTLPDGTTAQRTSKTMAYTHAVVVATDHRGQARDLRAKADRSEAYAKALQQWIDEGEDFSKLKHYKTGLGPIVNHNRQKIVEGYLPGFEPVEKQHTGRGLRGTYLADEGGFSIPDPADPYNNSDDYRRVHGATAYEKYGPAHNLKHHTEQARELRANADKLDAGPEQTYSVWRWSQSLANAAKGESEFSKVPHTRTQIVGVGGVAKERKAPAGPTVEEKAAARAAAKEAAKAGEKAASAARRQRFFDEKINGVTEALNGGPHADSPEWHLQLITEEGLVSLAKHLGVKVPNRAKNSMGNPLPRDRDALRRSIVEAVRERLGKA